jgi:hypothetical protein
MALLALLATLVPKVATASSNSLRIYAQDEIPLEKKATLFDCINAILASPPNGVEHGRVEAVLRVVSKVLPTIPSVVCSLQAQGGPPGLDLLPDIAPHGQSLRTGKGDTDHVEEGDQQSANL